MSEFDKKIQEALEEYKKKMTEVRNRLANIKISINTQEVLKRALKK